MEILPKIKNCADDFGQTSAKYFGNSIDICGVAGDQHGALIGQACFLPGMMKATYGTGCFALFNTGDKPVRSHNNLLTTLAYQLDGKRTYALEGSIFIAGAAVQWLRDGLGIIKTAQEADKLAAQADPTQDVYVVPAFVGLGAPYWNPNCRGALYGLTRATGPKEIARATLLSVCYQTSDLLNAMLQDTKLKNKITLRVDGGMANSNWTMQKLADILGACVERPKVLETTASGVAYLAGLHKQICPPIDKMTHNWHFDHQFNPEMTEDERAHRLSGWQNAVQCTLSFKPQQ